ncbi:hypothetical protein [Pyxidicoccus trucidator]|uniref:hypothetical protein n=1 Tax=Pyxidicoccus trucidator TaxID=2709662 RepID=UPI0013D9E654|nr:hypothetical protein [Pyxidicoccus trucidator]
MNLFAKTLLAGAAALVLAPMSALALPPDCSQERCNASTPCWIVCALPWSMQVVTCEEWVTEYEWGTCASDARDTDEDELSSAFRQDDSTHAESVCSEPMLTARAAE